MSGESSKEKSCTPVILYQQAGTLRRQLPRPKTKQEKLRELDAEMAEKLQQIQDLMTEGGLDGSAKIISTQIMPKLTASCKKQ